MTCCPTFPRTRKTAGLGGFPGNTKSALEVQRVLDTESMASLRLSKGCSTFSLSFLLSSQETRFWTGTGTEVSVEGAPTVWESWGFIYWTKPREQRSLMILPTSLERGLQERC